MIEIHEQQLALLIDGLLDISSYGVATGQSKITRMADETFERFRTFGGNSPQLNKTSGNWEEATSKPDLNSAARKPTK